MEDAKLQALHDTLAQLRGQKGLGTSSQYSWQRATTEVRHPAAASLPNNALYANFLPEGVYDPKSDAVQDGDGRSIKRDFSDTSKSQGQLSSSEPEVRRKRSKEEKKEAAKAAKLEAKRQAKLEEKKRVKKEAAKLNRRQAEQSSTACADLTATTDASKAKSNGVVEKKEKKSKKPKVLNSDEVPVKSGVGKKVKKRKVDAIVASEPALHQAATTTGKKKKAKKSR